MATPTIAPQKIVNSPTCGMRCSSRYVAKVGVAADVGKHRQRPRRDYGAANGQAVESVSQIDRVARTYNHQRDECDERKKCQRPKVRIPLQTLHHQIRSKLLDEGHDQLRRIHTVGLHRDQHHRNHDAGRDLQPQLRPSGQAQVSPVRHFGVVVGKSDGREGACGKDRNPHEAIAQIGPEQGRDHNRNRDQQAAHGRRPGFFLMRLRTFFANELSDLKFAQASDDQRAHDERGKQRSQAGECGAERQVAKDAERREVVLQLEIQQPVEQSASVPPKS